MTLLSIHWLWTGRIPFENKYDDHHPAILRMIRMVVEAAHAEGKKQESAVKLPLIQS